MHWRVNGNKSNTVADFTRGKENVNPGGNAPAGHNDASERSQKAEKATVRAKHEQSGKENTGRCDVSAVKPFSCFSFKTEVGRANGNSRIPSKRPCQESKVHSSHFYQASLQEILKCIGLFLWDRCRKLENLKPNTVISWLRTVDRSLLSQGWQDQPFLTPPNLVFLFLLLRETISKDTSDVQDLKSQVLACLYMAYTYSGAEISYPLRPFLVGDKLQFWNRCMYIINNYSSDMLKLNSDPVFFSQVHLELRQYRAMGEKRAAHSG